MSSSPGFHEIRCINRKGTLFLPKERSLQKVTFPYEGKEYVMFFDKNEILTWSKIHFTGALIFADYPFKEQDIIKDVKITCVYD